MDVTSPASSSSAASSSSEVPRLGSRQTANDMSESTFKPFPRLPTELRLKIWRLNLWPRLINMGVRRRDTDSRPLSERDISVWSAKLPTNMSVHRESRGEALKFYKPVYYKYGGEDALVYVNAALDTLFICTSCQEVGESYRTILSFMSGQNLSFRRIMASWCALSHWVEVCASLTSAGEGFEELILIPKASACYSPTKKQKLTDVTRAEWNFISVDQDYDETGTYLGMSGVEGALARLQASDPSWKRVLAELQAKNSSWKAPRIRTGRWIVPSDFSFTAGGKL